MRNKEGNKEKDIQEAAIKIFAQDGFHKAKISKIAETAGVAAGSVYLYFKSKEDILLKIFTDVLGKMFKQTETLVARNDLDAAEKFDGLIDITFDIFTLNPALAIVFVNEQNYFSGTENDVLKMYGRFLDLGERIVKQGINENIFNPNIDITVFRNFVFGGIRHLLHQWASRPGEFPLNGMRQTVKFILKKGINLS